MTRLFVGNLPYKATEQELREAFETGGFTVRAVKILMDRETGGSRGFGFVEVDESGAVVVEKMDGAQLMNRSLRVEEAKRRE